MADSGFVDLEQLAVLTAVVETYCKENGIDPTSDEREELAGLLGPLVRALAQRSVTGGWESARTVTIP